MSLGVRSLRSYPIFTDLKYARKISTLDRRPVSHDTLKLLAPFSKSRSSRNIGDARSRPVRLAPFADGKISRPHEQGLPGATIYALSTAPGRAAIAVIRISGSRCKEIYHLLCPGTSLPAPRLASLRTLHSPTSFSATSDSNTRHVLDSGALVLYFPAPRTVTGEEVLELHVHGGSAVVKAVLAAIGECNSHLQHRDAPNSSTATSMTFHQTNPLIRYAEPGEFTHRAFYNNRLSLLSVESLSDVLSAETTEQLRVSQSNQSHTRTLNDTYESWRQQLLHARGELEALIDFQEDQHFDEPPLQLASSVANQVRGLVGQIEVYKSNAVKGELLRSGIAVSLLGMPNVGKSSVLNLLVGRQAAIVSREAGTTRDVVEVGIDLGGFFVRIGDTAGIRGDDRKGIKSIDAIGDIEAEGIRRAKMQAQHSHLVILVLAAEESPQDQRLQLQLDTEILHYTKTLIKEGKRVVVLVNKMDLYNGMGTSTAEAKGQLRSSISQVLPDFAKDTAKDKLFFISCHNAATDTGDVRDDFSQGFTNVKGTEGRFTKDPGNVQNFLRGLVAQFKSMTSPISEENSETSPDSYHPSLGATQRQRDLLAECQSHLENFLSQVPETSVAIRTHPLDDDAGSTKRRGNGVEEAEDIDIVTSAESLRSAATCLSKITGKGQGAGDVEEVLGVVFEK